MDSTLQWKAHIDSLLMKLNAACYVLRTLVPIMSQQMLWFIFLISTRLCPMAQFFGVLHPTA